MKLFNIFKKKTKEKDISQNEQTLDNDISNEEYDLPILTRGDFPFTAELSRRQENEMLMKKYGIILEKSGEFI